MNDPRRSDPDLLLDQRLALGNYLEALLREVPEWTSEAPAQARLPAVAPAGALDPAPAPESVGTPASVTTPDPSPTPDPVAPPEPADVPVPQSLEGVPEWGRQRFQCLVFQVAGLSLAAPLTRLNGVIPWQEVTPMPNHSSKFLGLLQHQDQQVKVVDLAQIVLPEGQAAAPAEGRVGHIVLVDGGRWGLACDVIGEVLSLEPEEVRWRSAQGKRPWLAGTVLQHLCALLHTETLVQLLASGGQR